MERLKMFVYRMANKAVVAIKEAKVSSVQWITTFTKGDHGRSTRDGIRFDSFWSDPIHFKFKNEATSNKQTFSHQAYLYTNEYCLPFASNVTPSGFDSYSNEFQGGMADSEVAVHGISAFIAIAFVVSFLFVCLKKCCVNILLCSAVVITSASIYVLVTSKNAVNLLENEQPLRDYVAYIICGFAAIVIFYFIVTFVTRLQTKDVTHTNVINQDVTYNEADVNSAHVAAPSALLHNEQKPVLLVKKDNETKPIPLVKKVPLNSGKTLLVSEILTVSKNVENEETSAEDQGAEDFDPDALLLRSAGESIGHMRKCKTVEDDESNENKDESDEDITKDKVESSVKLVAITEALALLKSAGPFIQHIDQTKDGDADDVTKDKVEEKEQSVPTQQDRDAEEINPAGVVSLKSADEFIDQPQRKRRISRLMLEDDPDQTEDESDAEDVTKDKVEDSSESTGDSASNIVCAVGIKDIEPDLALLNSIDACIEHIDHPRCKIVEDDDSNQNKDENDEAVTKDTAKPSAKLAAVAEEKDPNVTAQEDGDVKDINPVDIVSFFHPFFHHIDQTEAESDADDLTKDKAEEMEQRVLTQEDGYAKDIDPAALVLLKSADECIDPPRRKRKISRLMSLLLEDNQDQTKHKSDAHAEDVIKNKVEDSAELLTIAEEKNRNVPAESTEDSAANIVRTVGINETESVRDLVIRQQMKHSKATKQSNKAKHIYSVGTKWYTKGEWHTHTSSPTHTQFANMVPYTTYSTPPFRWNRSRRPCRNYGSLRGCYYGNQCRFRHSNGNFM